eukprot:Skav200030  [mRNA]  locus=scaffold225:191473:196113:- [translate_table: standard]
MTREVPRKLTELLQDYEIFGFPGYPWTNHRQTAIVRIDEVGIDVDGQFLLGATLAPEGGSVDMFQAGAFPNCASVILDEKQRFAWKRDDEPSVTSGQVLLWNVIDGLAVGHPGSPAWIIDEHTIVIPYDDHKDQKHHFLELFAGGFGGWHMSSSFLRDHHDVDSQSVAIECDFTKAVNWTLAHNAMMLSANEPMSMCCFAQFTKDIMIHADVESKHWWDNVAAWRVDYMSISSPCPQWSNATTAQGLDHDQGCLLPAAILLARVFRPKILMLEQVNGFATHRHKKFCLEVVKHIGYRIHWTKVVDAADFGGVTRLRWLALAYRTHEPAITLSPFMMWPSMKDENMATIDAMFADPVPNAEMLKISDQMMTCATNPNMLPPNKRTHATMSGEETLATRVYTKHDKLPTIMAKYGSQHTLSIEALTQRGYMGHFLKTETGELRLIHPIEAGMAHIAYNTIVITHDFIEAWEQIGNQICMPQSMLLLVNALALTGTMLPIDEVFQNMWHQRMQATHVKSHTGPDHILFSSREFDPTYIARMLDEAHAICEQHMIPRHQIWIPDQGLQDVIAFQSQSANPVCSQITIEDATASEPEGTQPFQPVLRIAIQTTDQHRFFWAEASISPTQLEQMYDGYVQAVDTPQDLQGCSITLFMRDVPQVSSTVQLLPVVCLQENLMQCLDPASFPDSLFKPTEATLWDPMGPLKPGDRVGGYQMMCDFPLSHEPTDLVPSVFLAAAQMTEVAIIWDVKTMAFHFTFEGDNTEKDTMADFWATCISRDTVNNLDLQVSATENINDRHSHEVHIQNGQFAFPQHALATLLVVTATRRILDTLQTTGGVPITIKWHSRIVWQGSIHASIKVIVLTELLKHTWHPLELGNGMRLVTRGKVYYDVSVGELLHEHATDHLVFQAIESCSGGAGTKDTQKSYIRNSLAATFLEAGYPLDWVASTTEILQDKIPTKSLLQVVQTPPGKQRLSNLIQLSQQCDIALPEKLGHFAMKTAMNNQNKSKKKRAVVLDPQEYTIEAGFFRNQDGSAATQIAQVMPRTNGVVLSDYPTAAQWIEESQTITPDELALVLIGRHNLSTKLPAEVVQVPCKDRANRPVILACTVIQLGERAPAEVVQVPCKDRANRPVILACTVIQLGERAIKTQRDEHPVIDEVACTTISITFWHDDWTPEEWTKIVDQPYQYAKMLLTKQGHNDLLQATWGKSLRQGGQPTTVQLAASVQFHATIQTSALDTILSSSGYNKMFIVPKTTEGRIHPDWRIIWVEGSWAHVTALGMKTKHCMGVVKNRSSLGLRFAHSHYTEAWKILCPDKAEPKRLELKHLYKIEPLPHGTTATMLEQWAKHHKWDIAPVKPLGAVTWLIGSDQLAPCDILQFNGRPMILKWLAPRSTSFNNPIVAGPMPKTTKGKGKGKTAEQDPYGPFFDPWQGYQKQTTADTPVVRDTAGPTEARFQAQDEKIAAIEAKLTQLHTNTQAEFVKVEQREQHNMQQMQQSLASVKHDLENAFQQSLAQHSNSLNDTLKDLKTMLAAVPKRKVPEPGVEEMQQD